MNIELNEQRRSVRVESDGALILGLEEFPVAALKTQLRAWLQSADEMPPAAFVFNSEDPGWHGIFRIEPRPERWQFTSWKERVRSSELLSIEEWRSVLRRSGV